MEGKNRAWFPDNCTDAALREIGDVSQAQRPLRSSARWATRNF